ncbi:hypothetical protein LXL04_034477 [Taraxacum kok-saghyz]
MGSNQASTDSHLPVSYPLCFAFSTTFFTPSSDLSTKSMGSSNLEISFTHDFLCQRDPNQDRSAYFFLFFFIIAYGVKIICLGWMFPCITCPDLPGIAKRIAAGGYGVYAIDYPGFGLSEGLHGYIPNFSDLVGNVIEQHTKIKGRPEVRGMPRFLLGQSMGGAVALKVHLKEQQEMKPPEPLQKVIIFLSRLMPKAKLVPQKDLAELMFRDSQKRKLAEKAASKDKQLKLYDGSYHCILEGESDERIFEVLDDIIAWLDSHCALR